MASEFILKNAEKSLKKDTYYRLDFVRGVDLTSGYSSDTIFKTILINFCEYSEDYQDIEKIISIPIRDRFKNSIKGTKVTVQTVSLPEDITNLVLLKPSSVWRNGALVWEPSDSLNIEIKQNDSSITNFKKESDTEKFPFIKNSAHSNLIKFPGSSVDGATVTVLIPVMEVIRYYFSGSRYFTTMLFNGGMEADQIKSAFIYKSDFNAEELSVYVWLRRKCQDSDAILLARAIANEDACHAMRLIYSSLVNIIALYDRKNWELKECCPKTNLPFSDATEMEVQGQWLPPDKEGKYTTYLVRTIEQCNHSLPFNSIEIESVDSYRSSNRNSPKPLIRKKISRDDANHKPTLTENEQPNGEIAAQELEFYTDRFSYLSDIHISKVIKSSEKEQQIYTKMEEEEPESDDGSTQLNNYQQDNNLEPWEIIARTRDSESIPVNERLSITASVIYSIEQEIEGLFITALPENMLDGALPYGFYDFKTPKGKNQNYTWSFVGDRRRKALFVRAEYDQKHVYLLEIEGKNNAGFSLYVLSGPKFNQSELKAENFLQSIAEKSGNEITSGVFSKRFSEITSLKHTTNSEDSFADRLARTLKSVLIEVRQLT